MNLVAKEFVCARSDGLGVLVLSRFAGAARQLGEALIVNPYAIDLAADALAEALRMPEAEQAGRMRQLRATVARFDSHLVERGAASRCRPGQARLRPPTITRARRRPVAAF